LPWQPVVPVQHQYGQAGRQRPDGRPTDPTCRARRRARSAPVSDDIRGSTGQSGPARSGWLTARRRSLCDPKAVSNAGSLWSLVSRKDAVPNSRYALRSCRDGICVLDQLGDVGKVPLDRDRRDPGRRASPAAEAAAPGADPIGSMVANGGGSRGRVVGCRRPPPGGPDQRCRPAAAGDGYGSGRVATRRRS
jgi:hypothetical protein